MGNLGLVFLLIVVGLIALVAVSELSIQRRRKKRELPAVFREEAQPAVPILSPPAELPAQTQPTTTAPAPDMVETAEESPPPTDQTSELLASSEVSRDAIQVGDIGEGAAVAAGAGATAQSITNYGVILIDKWAPQLADNAAVAESLRQLVAGRITKRAQVFISSVIHSDEMRAARQMAKQGVEAVMLARPWLLEDQPASSNPPAQLALAALRESRIYVLLLGKDISEAVITEYELAWALAHEPTPKILGVFVFVQEVDERTPAATAFLNRLTVHWKSFRTPADLSLLVGEAVGNELGNKCTQYGFSYAEIAALWVLLREKGHADLFTLPSPQPTLAPSPAPNEPHVEPPRAEPTRQRPQPRVAIDHEMITIPAGEFIMGSTRTQIEKLVQQYGEKWRWLFEAEAPQHRVYLPTYRISKYPVTNAQFAEFIKASGYKTTAEKVGSGYIWNSSQWQEVKGANWQHPRGPDSEVWHKQDHPVTQVSWHDVCAFCEWTSKITDSRVRLPTEAEWEKAARGTDGRLYPWGNQQDVQRCNCFESKIGDTTAVNQYPSGASLCGVIDMVGNIWEWTSSLWGKKEKEPDFKYPYRATDGRENLEVTDTFRVIRGGSWYDVAVNARGADRSRINPHVRNDNVGFRVAESSPK